MATLAQMPNRRPLAAEDFRFKETVRELIYRRTPRTPAYRILFVLRTPEGESPTVLIISFRHGAQAPMTRKEAREIEDSE